MTMTKSMRGALKRIFIFGTLALLTMIIYSESYNFWLNYMLPLVFIALTILNWASLELMIERQEQRLDKSALSPIKDVK